MNSRRQAGNMLLNILWTAVFLGPVCVFSISAISGKTLSLFLLAATLPLLMPRTLLQRLQLSNNRHVYQLLGVPLLVKVTQDAPWIRQSGSDLHRRVSRNREAITRLQRDTWTRERFHLGVLVFCALCAGVALWGGQFLWFTTLILVNLLYNLYPVWLQQYIRLRASRLLRDQRCG
jgi:Glycosyl-4,4'-diaponeurosporenoate acyltransferase